MANIVEMLQERYPEASVEDLIYALQEFINDSMLRNDLKNAQTSLSALTELALRGAAYV